MEATAGMQGTMQGAMQDPVQGTIKEWQRRLLVMTRFYGLVVLASLVLASAFGVVYTKHLTRLLFTQLQTLEQEAESLQIEWGQLLLEQATWAADARIERIAKDRLEMRVPETNQIVVIPHSQRASDLRTP